MNPISPFFHDSHRTELHFQRVLETSNLNISKNTNLRGTAEEINKAREILKFLVKERKLKYIYENFKIVLKDYYKETSLPKIGEIVEGLLSTYT